MIPLSVHLELDAERTWYIPFILDASTLIWKSYGISSKIGRSIERTMMHTANGMRVFFVDEAYADGFRDESLFPDEVRVPGTPERKNRFDLPSFKRGRPHGMSLKLHKELGIGLKRSSKFFDRVLDVYEGRDVCSWFRKGQIGISKIRTCLAGLLTQEHPGASVSIYLDGT